MSVVTTAAALVVFPVLAGIAGGVVAVLRPPRASVVSGIQHFAAGVVMAAVAGEVLPELREVGSLWLVVVGFSAGALLFIGLRQLEGERTTSTGVLPVGFLAVIAIDLLVDGLLVGAGAAVSVRTGTILSIALTVEVLFITLAVALKLAESGVSKVRTVLITAAMSVLVAIGAVLGAVLLAGAGTAVLSLVLAFAAAALLWLVVEELLVEAHEIPERPWMAAMFFVGFLMMYGLGAAG